MSADSEPPNSATVEEIVATYGEMFKHRYTDDDQVFQKYLDTPLPDPPSVENWYQRPKRNFDFSRGDRGRRGGWDNRRRDDRNRGHGGGQRDGPGYGMQREWDNRQRHERVHYPGWKQNRRDDRHHPYQQRDNYGQRPQSRDQKRDRYDRGGDRGGRHNQWRDY